jgi:Uma2 family endonuclease
MNKFAEIRYSLAQLNDVERKDIIAWLERFGERIQSFDRIEDSEEPAPAYGAPFPETVSAGPGLSAGPGFSANSSLGASLSAGLSTGPSLSASSSPSANPTPTYMTRDEFLDFQEQSFTPYEYVNGIIRAMSGPSVAHCLITQNIHRALDARLRGGPCQSFCTGGEINLTLGDDEIVYHPDVYVSCDRSVWDPRWIPNPKFVVEVLSPTTQDIDRREKAFNYRRVDSLDEYVMASQKRPEVTVFRRADRWRPSISVGLRTAVEFRSFGVSVSLAEIYEGVIFASTLSDNQD